MRAIRLTAPRSVEVVKTDPPAVGPGEALIRVLACGVCGSDLNAWRGVPGIEYPLPVGAPGHEAWGEVVQVGPPLGTEHSALNTGQRVTGLLQAGYAQYALARADELVTLPPILDSDPLLGEPLACAANVVRRACVGPDDRVAVVGFGYLAALVVQLLYAGEEPRGRWVAVSRRDDSRELALRLGAEAAYPFESVPDHLWDSFPVVIEAAGVQQSLDYATWLTAYGGRLVIAGYHADGPRTVNMQSWNWKGLDVINAHERHPHAYLRGLREGLAAVQRDNLDLSSLITHRWPLDQATHALTTADTRPPGYIKGVILPWE